MSYWYMIHLSSFCPFEWFALLLYAEDEAFERRELCLEQYVELWWLDFVDG